MWLLDTNAWVVYLTSRSASVEHRILTYPNAQILMCDIVKFELLYGAYKSKRIRTNLDLLEQVFSKFHSLPFDGKSAKIAGHLRAELASQGTPIGPYDLLIAATALANDMTLVTHNVTEFQRVPNLSIEDWEA